MSNIRAPDEDIKFLAEKDYMNGMKYKDIAAKHKVSLNTIKSWKQRYNWNRKSVHTNKKVCTQNNRKELNKKDNKEPIVDEVKELLEDIELTDKQRLFCIYYINCFNAAKAYKKAYECSYESALSNGYRLMGNDSIRKGIETLKKYKLNKAMISEEDIFQRYLDIAYASITDYLEFGNQEINIGSKKKPKYIKSNYIHFKDSKELDGTVISEVKQGKNGISLKLHDALKALEWLSEHMNIATDKQKADIEFVKANINLVNIKAEEVEGRLF